MLLDQIQTDLNQALKTGDKDRLSVLRYLLAEIKNRQIDHKGDFKDEDVLSAIKMQIKQHQEAIDLYRQGKREDLVANESQEMTILDKYLPRQMANEQLEKIVQEVMEKLKPTGPQDFGKLMKEVMAKVKGQADGSAIAELVKKALI